MIYKELQKYKNQQLREFNKKLIPNIDKEILGVNYPILKKIAKSLNINDEFLNDLPHKYHEEDIIHGYYLNYINDYKLLINNLNEFLKYVNNWAVVDTMLRNSIVLKENKIKFFNYLIELFKTNKTYYIRFSINMFMRYYMNEHNDVIINLIKENSNTSY